MIAKSFMLLLVAAAMSPASGRLDNSYLPPRAAAGDSSGNGNTLAAPSSTSPIIGSAINPTNLPTSVESHSDNNHHGDPDAGAAILKIENTRDADGGYRFEYETENQIRHSESGVLKKAGEETEVLVVEGSYSYLGLDDVMYTVTYVADENGFRASGEHIPTAPPAALDTMLPEQGSDASAAAEHDDSPYHRQHNHDTQAVIIEAQPQADTARQYLPLPTHGNQQQQQYDASGY